MFGWLYCHHDIRVLNQGKNKMKYNTACGRRDRFYFYFFSFQTSPFMTQICERGHFSVTASREFIFLERRNKLTPRSFSFWPWLDCENGVGSIPCFGVDSILKRGKNKYFTANKNTMSPNTQVRTTTKDLSHTVSSTEGRKTLRRSKHTGIAHSLLVDY